MTTFANGWDGEEAAFHRRLSVSCQGGKKKMMACCLGRSRHRSQEKREI